MFHGLRTIVYRVADLAAAKEWYTNIVGPPYFDQPFYVGFNVGGYELGLTPADEKSTTGATTYWGVSNAEEAYVSLLQLGGTRYESVHDVGDGIKVGAVLDPFGNILGVIENPHFKLAPV